MNASDASTTGPSRGKEDFPLCFGEWLKRRRQQLDLTQEQLGQRASCSVFAIRKIEMGERRPSRQLTELLAKALQIPAENQPTFIQVARGERGVEYLDTFLPGRAALPAGEPSPTTGNLPRALTPFIGREAELGTLGQLLRDPQCSLITIVGPGGIGKTRLAIEAVQHVQDLFPDGIWFVPLAPLNSPTLIVPTIADAVNFRFQDPTDPQAQLLRYLCENRSLLILDNAEHLLDGVGLFAEILKHCPQVKLLVTSRERLNLLSEWVFEIMGLPLPPSDRVEQFESYSSVALFLQSARRVRAGFQLAGEDRHCVLRICQILEGIPLGIELAAAWVGLLSCEEIAKEIERNIDFLTVTMHDLPEGHRSMRAVFQHSWRLLTEEEQQVLSRLSVFRGGFTLDAAKQVAGASLLILSSLVSKSLVQRAGAGRYSLHELLRQYAAAYLEADPSAFVESKKQHYAFYLALAEAANSQLRGSRQLESLSRLEDEHDNLRAAMEWSLIYREKNSKDNGGWALKLVDALRWFWYLQGYYQEGYDWLTKALKQNPQSSTMAYACALEGAGLLAQRLGDFTEAYTLSEEAVAIFQRLGNHHGLAEALTLMALALHGRGETTLSGARFETALKLYRQTGDKWGIARGLYNLGSWMVEFGDRSAGRAMLEESVAILDELSERHLITGPLNRLGVLALSRGDLATAHSFTERSLVLSRENGDPEGIANSLTTLGRILGTQGNYTTARLALEEVLSMYRRWGHAQVPLALSALVENDIAEGNFPAARVHMQESIALLREPANPWWQVSTQYYLGLLAYYEGDMVSAVSLLEGSRSFLWEINKASEVAPSLIALGRAMRAQGDTSRAAELISEGFGVYCQLEHKLGIAISLEGLAGLVAQSEAKLAARLFGAANAIRENMGVPLAPVDRPMYERDIATVRAQLSETALASAWTEGAAMPMEKAITYAGGIVDLINNYAGPNDEFIAHSKPQ